MGLVDELCAALLASAVGFSLNIDFGSKNLYLWREGMMMIDPLFIYAASKAQKRADFLIQNWKDADD